MVLTIDFRHVSRLKAFVWQGLFVIAKPAHFLPVLAMF
jgi:hypothetical protein